MPPDTMLSRSGQSNPDGKMTHRIDVPVGEKLHDGMAALAILARLPKAEYARRVFEQHVFGRLSMLQMMGHEDSLGQYDESGSHKT